MELSALAGNGRVKELLSQREEGRGLSHAYIIAGPVGSGRHTLARLLCAGMMCTSKSGRPCGRCTPCKKVFSAIHPDVSVVSGPAEGRPITVDQIRAVRSDAHIRPNEGERKVYLLEGADRMQPPAQNAMLKLLEEGPAYAAFLLLADNAGGLLQTVRSRCEELTLAPVPLAESEGWLKGRFPDKSGDAIRAAALSCQGILGRAVDELEGKNAASGRNEQVKTLADALEGTDEAALFQVTMVLDKAGKEDVSRVLDALEGELTGRMVRQSDRRRLMRAVELVKQVRTAVSFNVNAGQLAGWLCAGMFHDT